ncbi:MAG: hypothetical protein CME46_00010 [Halieaceae bacterium]|nr:hypothetical protein [Halieaceae bacterium]|tara:strand:- start:974 stop:1171 length:198 start_codon:yes stop_codon:yes gene_type:complete
MSDTNDKKVVHEIKLSKPVLVLLWFVAIGMVGKPVGTMVFPEAMAQLDNYDTLTLNIRHSGSISN